MTKNANFVSHKKSKQKNQDGTPQLPLASALVEGEIAINFAENVETLSIKNESGHVVTFSSDNYYTEKKLGSGFTGANSAVTVTEALENVEIDVDQVIDSGTSASTNAVATKAVYDKIVDTELVWTNAYVAMSGAVSSHTVNTNIHLANGDREKIDSIDTLSGTVTAHTANTEIHVTSADKEKLHTHDNKSALDAITGNVGTMAYENKTSYSSATEVNTALGNKAETTALTQVNNTITAHTADTTIHVTAADKEKLHTHSNKTALDSITGTVGTMAYQNAASYSSATEVNTALGNKANTTDLASYADSVKYNSTSHYVEFYHGTTAGTKVFEYDASPFIIDGMVQNVEIKDVTSGGSEVTCLVISFNTDAGKQDINVPISDIFDANNYYNKTAIDNLVGSGFTSSSITDVIIENEEIVSAALTDLDDRKLDATAYTPTDLTNYYTKSETSGATEISNALGGKVNSATYTGHTADTTVHFTTGDVQTQIDNSISGKVNTSDIISAITPSNSGSTAPIATKVVAENELTVSNALNDLNTALDGKSDTGHTHSISDIASLDVKIGIMSAVTVNSDLSNVTCPDSITGVSNNGAQAIVIYENEGTTTDYTITVSTSYKSPDGNQISVTCPKNGYCELSYININGTIYARGV